MYRNIRNYELKYTDVDVYDNLKISSLLSFLEESACHSAEELGFGYEDIMPKHIGFIVTNWYIELNRPIKLGEILTVHTWPIKPRLMIFLRDFELYVGGEKVGVITSRWCMISTDSFAVLPVSAYFKEGDFDNYNTERSIDFKAWKIPAISDEKIVYSKAVKYSDYDHYFHLNNTKYADYLMDVFSVEELAGKSVACVQITYVKQCKEGEIIDFIRRQEGENYFIEGKVNSDLRVQMRIKFNGV